MVESDINRDNKWEIVKQTTLGDKVSAQVKNAEAIKETTMYETTALQNKKLTAGETATLKMEVEKRLSTEESKNLVNQVEIVCIDKPFGSNITTVPGNYIPVRLINNPTHENDDSTSEQILVISNQGGNRNYVIYITIGLAILTATAVGIYAIKKKRKE